MIDHELRAELLAAFEAEYREHLQAIRGALDAGAVSGASLRDVFRRAHSLKGAARAVDLPEVEEIAHGLESLLFACVETGQALPADAVATVRRGLDGIETRMREPAGSRAPEAGPLGSGPLESGQPEAGPTESGAAVPDMAEPGPRRPVGPEPADAAAVLPSSAATSLRVPAAEVDRLADAMQALNDAMQRQEHGRLSRHEAAAEAAQLVRLLDGTSGGVSGGLPGVRGGAPGLGEFGRRLSQLSRRLAGDLRDGASLDWQLDEAARRLREQVGRLALVEAEPIFGPLAAMVRDLAREMAGEGAAGSGGDVEIRLSGLQLRAERQVLQALRDPAIQLLRNAVGHGTAARDATDARIPLISLTLSLRVGRLEMVVADDGPGPDLARIEQTAIRHGLLPERAAGARPPDEARLLALVFEPGFSTAVGVDRLSGRGMGLSIVAEAARRLNGSVLMRRGRDARGRPVGTELVVSVPLAARRQSVLLVEAAGHIVALPSAAVERLLRLASADVEWPEGHPVAHLRADGASSRGDAPPHPGQGIVLRLLALPALLGGPDTVLATRSAPASGTRMATVLLRSGGALLGLVVDRLHDVRTLVVRAPDAIGIDRQLVAGIATIENGRPVLVLEPDALVAAAGRARPGPALQASGTPAPPAPDRPRSRPTILVVDDSITTRTLEKTILQAQGYRVLVAVDGLEALGVLRTAQWEVDVVVADVEMPRLDGFGLLAAMRADPRLAPIPTVLMTSRDAEADVRRGLELGARAYITKQDFDQGALLRIIGQLLP
ncbi:hybrid sensor histidine kinase/response regulator [Lichenicola sp.]|uniref:hybrid sensor histidine kinase/response regulator n=1 Tax=Lichenicola sp. TaxID=2804529 RepID=UPI003AFFBBF8